MTGIIRDRLILPDDPEEKGRIWQQHLAPVFDIEFGRHSELLAPLQLDLSLCGEMIIGSVDAPAQRLTRSRRKVSQQGIDHVLLQFYTSGASTVVGGETPSAVKPAQVVVFDLSRPVDVEAQAVRAFNLILPRKMLGDASADLGQVHGCALDYDTDPVRRLLFTTVRELAESMDRIDPAQAVALSQAAAALCRACLPMADTEKATDRAVRKLAIKQFVEEAIGLSDLDITMVVTRFGLSRPTLQRLFEAEGGFASYVRERRLQRAFASLAGRARPNVAAVAFEHGFGNAQTFSKAFQRRFGLAPTDVASEPSSRNVGEDEHQVLLSWLNQLI